MTKEAQHDAIYNEGGEGYNPHRAAREDREWQDHPRTRADRKLEINRRLDVLGTRDYPGSDEERQALHAEAAEIEAAEQAEFAAEWTPATTISRRAGWNDQVNSGQIKTAADVARAARLQGWSLYDLKKAVALHAAA